MLSSATLIESGMSEPETLDTLLHESDFVSVHTDLNDSTRGLFNLTQFRKMKPSAVFINTARGPIVNEPDLIEALRTGVIFAAGLDVTDPEPLPKGHALWSRNVIVTPHSAGKSPGGLRRLVELYAENLRRFAAGEQLLNIVDKKAGY